MLILAKITGTSAGGYAGYLEGKTQAPELGDYYLKDGERTEAPGRWAQGAGQFGLDPDRPVTGRQLRTLMSVRRPDTGEQLRRAGASGEVVAALDAAFSAPKSVSAAWALAAPGLRERIEAAHETAIDRALDHATRQVPMLRRRDGQGGVVHEKAAGLVATSWRHTTARAVDGRAPDPQLHSHVPAARGGARGRAARGDRFARVAGAPARGRRGVPHRACPRAAALGFAVRRGTGRGGRYFELDAIPQALLDRWSSRHHQVHAAIRQRLVEQEQILEAAMKRGGSAATRAAEQLKALRQNGQLSPAQERLMGTITRSQKTPVTVTDLDAEWRRTALRLGVSRERIEVLRRQPATLLAPASPRELLDALTEFDATFPARDARAVALERSAGQPIGAAIEQLSELRAREDILVLADGTATTRRHRGRERTVVAIAGRLAARQLDPLPAATIARETKRLDTELAQAGGQLSDEQRAAIHVACGTSPLVIIEGQAGTGKSTTLTGIARAHQAVGREILLTSTAAQAAERLARDLADHGVNSQAYSTAALNVAITHERVTLTPQTTIIHDEAALASTSEQLQLLEAVESSGARLISVGDPRQNQPVGAGGLWNHIEHAAQLAGANVKLTRNQRARDPADRRDQALLRDGHAEQAVHGYHARDRVHVHHDPRRVEDQALDAAHADRTQGRTTIVIAQTSNEHLDPLNARAQAIRHQAGELSEHSLPVPGRPYQLHEGDLVHIRHTIQHPDHGPLRNGIAGRIAAIDADTRTLDLQLDNAVMLTLTETQAADADLRLAYVQHPFPAQGQTTDTTHLIIGEHATREGTYVGLTRARHSTNIYATDNPELEPGSDPLHELAERISRTEPDVPSIHTPLAHETALSRENSIETAAPGETRTPDRNTALEQDASAENRLDETARTARSWPRTLSDEALRRIDDGNPERGHSHGFEP